MPPITGPVIFADRPWFQRLLATRDFVVSEYLIGRLSKKPIMLFAGPVFDKAGTLVAIIGVSMDLDWLNQFLAGDDLPRGTVITMIDRDGRVLARHPDPEGLVGPKMGGPIN